MVQLHLVYTKCSYALLNSLQYLKKALSIVVLAITACCLSTSSNNSSVAYIDSGYLVETPVQLFQEVYIKPGDSVSRFFGDLKITLKLSKTGTYVDCNLYLSTQLLGVQTLTPDQNEYDFDLQLNNYKAKGQFILLLNEGPYALSKVSANFTYSVVSIHESFACKGDLIAWHLKE